MLVSIAISIPHQLIEDGGILTGSDAQAAPELVMKARRALIDSGLIAKDFSTAEQILERRKNLLKCTTGSSKLDSFLKGGIETQAMTEVAREFGSGKSQLCYTLCVTANMSLDKEGLGGNVIFIDTENTFRPERIHQIAENRGIKEPEAVAKPSGYKGEIILNKSLYAARPEAYLKVMRGLSDEDVRVLIIGHNPGLEELVEMLTGEIHLLATCSLAHVKLRVDKWSEIDNKIKGKVAGIWRPGDLT